MLTIGVTVSEARSFPAELFSLKENFIIKEIRSGDLKSSLDDCDILYFWNLVYDELLETIDSGIKLPKFIYVARQGEDEWLLDKLSGTNSSVGYAKNVFSDSIAEYVVAAMMMLSKNLHLVATQRDWKKYTSNQINNSKALILGRGSIGRQIQELVGALGVETVMIGRKDVRALAEKSFRPSRLYEKIRSTDHVICCLPLDETTKNVLDLSFFSNFKQVNFINISRGEVLNEYDFNKAIDMSYIRAAMLDAFSREPLEEDNILWDDRRVVVSPHQSYRSQDWENRLHQSFIDYVKTIEV